MGTRPFQKANSYGTFFRRAMQRLFRRPCSVSLWRHAWVNANIDLNAPYRQRQRAARLCLHSTDQQDSYMLHV